ncbi:MAG TPA: hypothetical protein PKA82_04415 [Pyrinomonadaceae bacterium]|nr:hypothetical protein [Pyrinomonadaceae bacterium]
MDNLTEIRTLLEIGAFAAQVISLPVAAITLVANRIENKASRDLQVALTLSESFRRYWEDEWEAALERIEEHRKLHLTGKGVAKLPIDDEKHLRHMLNWVDWLGTFIHNKAFTNPKLILGSVEFRLRQILAAGESIIVEESWLNGLEYWNGVIAIAGVLKIETITRIRRAY